MVMNYILVYQIILMTYFLFLVRNCGWFFWINTNGDKPSILRLFKQAFNKKPCVLQNLLFYKLLPLLNMSTDMSTAEKKFRSVTTSQDGIQSLSLWAIHYKAQHEKIVDVWFKVLKKCKLHAFTRKGMTCPAIEISLLCMISLLF